MKYAHTYCFYMNNGEHLMIDADDCIVGDNFIQVHREKDGDQIFMVVYKDNLMAWEVIR